MDTAVTALEQFLQRTSALELARRSLIGAPVYAVVSLIILFGTPVLNDYGIWAALEAGLLVLLGIVRMWFAKKFEQRYERLGERAVVQFSVLTALQSICFGVLAAVVVWKYWAMEEAVLTVVLAVGCIAAGTSALSVRRSAHLIFLASVLAPVCVAVLIVGGLTKALLICGFLVLMAFLVQDGGQARRVYLDHLRTQFESEMSRRRAEIEIQARKEFFRDIGHEIRTPLTSIIGMSSLLQREPLSERANTFVDVILKSCDNLEALVENVPGAMQSRRQIQSATPNSINLQSYIHAFLEMYRPQADSKSIDLLARAEDLPEVIRIIDYDFLEQVLANLLSNAVEHTHRGSVTVFASCQWTDEQHDRLTVEVTIRDTGEGIPADKLPSLFEERDEHGIRVSGKNGGSGLGLLICKGLVSLMGGEIRLQSAEDVGTMVTFTFTADLDPSCGDWQPAAEVLETGDGARMPARRTDHPQRILVVDDHETNRGVLSHFLREMGYTVEEAGDGQEAVAAVLQSEYELIFMDIRMPKMNGIEATRWIRQHGMKGSNTRIIALTGDASEETREDCMAAGVDDFISKPIRPEGLGAILAAQSAAKS